MRSRDFNLSMYAADADTDVPAERDEISRSQYRRHRSFRTAKRSSARKGGSQPGVGIAGRRNRRWSW